MITVIKQLLDCASTQQQALTPGVCMQSLFLCVLCIQLKHIDNFQAEPRIRHSNSTCFKVNSTPHVTDVVELQHRRCRARKHHI